MSNDEKSEEGSSAVPRLKWNDVMLGVGNPLRWRILRELCQGPLLVGELSERLGKNGNIIYKHVRSLVDGGLVSVNRAKQYSIPPEFVAGAGVLDYGYCVVRLG